MKKADAITHFGSASKLARALGITLQAIGQWGDDVPLLRQYQIERITGGKLRADNPNPTAVDGQAQRA